MFKRDGLILFCVIYSSCLPDDSYFDLTGVLHRIFNLFSDIPGQADRIEIIDIFGANENANFTTGLEGVALVDPFE